MKYKRIRQLREDADMTQTELAKILHCSQRVYSNYELGERDIPTAILIALAQFHHTTTDYILELSDIAHPCRKRKPIY
ncbi:MAG: helix-turn-helix transcriptional regulator [Schwartzia sp.]|nr:helix-turn-helix transcriptional regulator [Schwartzia sp. (in: firmicutes)]